MTWGVVMEMEETASSDLAVSDLYSTKVGVTPGTTSQGHRSVYYQPFLQVVSCVPDLGGCALSSKTCEDL